MKVCFVYKEDYPWDIRVEKMLHFFRDENHTISLVCRNLKCLPSREYSEGVEIWRLPAVPKIFRFLNRLSSTPFFGNPVWAVRILQCIWSNKSELLVVRDLPLMPLAIFYGKLLKVRVIFDMAECYPEMYASTLRFSDNILARRLTKNPSIAGIIEKFCVKHSDMTFVMIEESLNRLISLGCSPRRIRIVSNTPSKVGPTKESSRLHDSVRLFYVGFVTRIRGIENALRGIRAYLDRPGERAEILLEVIGVGPAL